MKVDRGVQDRLHADVCASDPTAWSRVFTTLIDPLVDWLGFRWPDHRDSERLHDFAVDSIMSYLQAPGRYDPTKSSLLSYLCMDAHGDLLNEHDRLQRNREAEHQVVVEVSEQQRKGVIDQYPSDREPPLLTFTQIREAFPDERDRRAVLLLIDGERSTKTFAEATAPELSAPTGVVPGGPVGAADIFCPERSPGRLAAVCRGTPVRDRRSRRQLLALDPDGAHSFGETSCRGAPGSGILWRLG